MSSVCLRGLRSTSLLLAYKTLQLNGEAETCTQHDKTKHRTALIVERSSAKAADTAKLLLFNKRRGVSRHHSAPTVPPNRNTNTNTNVTCVIRITTKIWRFLLWPFSRLSTKFCYHRLSSFCVSLLTNKLTPMKKTLPPRRRHKKEFHETHFRQPTRKRHLPVTYRNRCRSVVSLCVPWPYFESQTR